MPAPVFHLPPAIRRRLATTRCWVAVVWWALSVPAALAQNTVYLPSEESLSARKTPVWFENAKLGIFIHWGLYSVPGWATPTATPDHVADWRHFYKNNPYAEWYLNSLRIAGSPTQAHHAARYGKDFDYYRFADTFNLRAGTWNAAEWAALFHQAGAQYVVMTAKHHDGFVLYPSRVPNPHADPARLHAQRDLVGALAAAARRHRLRFGVYYSGGLDWTFYRSPITNLWPDLFQSMPHSVAYTAYADNHLYEIIHRYQPDILWNDVNFPQNGDLLGIWAELYNHNPEAVVNNRWGRHEKLTGFDTPEYQVLDSISIRKWETCRGIGYSFGYNRIETDAQFLSPDALVDMFVDIVSKNGNLLLNVGPRADGTIPEPQARRLRDLGGWLKTNGKAIYGTRPWTISSLRLADGTRVRFTRTDTALYACLLDAPKSKTIRLPGIRVASAAGVRRLGGSPLRHRQAHGGLEVTLDGAPDAFATVIEIALLI